MKIGIPRGLLYSKYHAFAKTFLEELGAEIVVSPETGKQILDEGVRLCVDDACLPMKVFHGHVSWLKTRCDAILIPRFIGIREKEYICPMFCGLVEMVSNSIADLPRLIDTPVYSTDRDRLYEWAKKTGAFVTRDENLIAEAFGKALSEQARSKPGFSGDGYAYKAGLIGHIYNISDRFVNMDLINKLNALGIGAVTSDVIDRAEIDAEAQRLYKKPFWSFARDYYGAAATMCRAGMVHGIIYLSSFSCGIDSVVIELIKNEIGDFPFMVLKLDEHTGEAGFNTRLEAFSDMLKRRIEIGNHLPSYGKCRACGESPLRRA